MDIQTVFDDQQPLDLIVGGEGQQVIVELDVQHNAGVQVGDRYVAPGDGYLTMLRVSHVEFAQGYDNFTARQTRAIREGRVEPPVSRPEQEALQRKVVTMQIEGELHADGRRTSGASRLPERLTPVQPASPDLLARFASSPDGNVILGLLRTGDQATALPARLRHNFAGDRMVHFGMPGSGKSQHVRGIIAQQMARPQDNLGMLILDRAGEYVENTRSQDGHVVYGLPHHPLATDSLVIVSRQARFRTMASRGQIHGHLAPVFSLADIAPVDLADFFAALTPAQRALLKDYAHDPALYAKLLRESKLGQIDKSNWYRDFPGLFELTKNGKQLLKVIEQEAEEGDDLTDDQLAALEAHLGGSKVKVMERIVLALKRLALNPFLGGQRRGRDILAVCSSMPQILNHLGQGKTVVVDLRGVEDQNYTLLAALFARQLLTQNKQRPDERHIRACLVMEEAHNILSEADLRKGAGQGSVFIELAREGRKLKLGFMLVTQQPDARSIAAEIAATLDTIVAFNMPPDNADYLSRLQSAFGQYKHAIMNARTFEGVAISRGRATPFRAEPVLPAYMQACVEDSLADYLVGQLPAPAVVEPEPAVCPPPPEDRLSRLLRQRNEAFQHLAAETMAEWQADGP